MILVVDKMKKKIFKLYLAGLGKPSLEPTSVECTDYDEDVNLVRYKDWVYDIPTGRWAMKLDWMKRGIMIWKSLGCSQVPSITMTEMIHYLKNNLIFMKALEKERAKAKFEEINTEEYNLFNMEE